MGGTNSRAIPESLRGHAKKDAAAKFGQDAYSMLLDEVLMLDLFTKLDSNGDNKLNLQEFAKLPGLLEDISPTTMARRDIKEVFDCVDVDHDEVVTWREFVAFMAEQLPWIQAGITKETFDRLKTEFATLDANGDYQLSRQEFDDFSRLPGHLGMDADDVKHLFDCVDVDQSGSISLLEFISYMAKRKDELPLAVQVEPQRNDLQRNMDRLGFELCRTDKGERGVKGDGNCQFYSLSWELFKTTTRHAEVRAKIVEYLRGPGREDFSVFYAPSHPRQPATFDGYLDEMAKPTTWGDQLTLQAAANVFAAKVYVLTADQFSASGRPILVISPAQEPKHVIWVSFAALHYSPIAPTTRTPSDLRV
eukprot:TRINITY_DN30597_c0_g1_i1.p1 TRINITY_DN30597_c0_g1~~TRINITY_DN30597_c0_g1_i1.p1  ORF type:complete len:363 (-),score=67.09 TRINITY_DN30597_c0_g1_i1:104-1192(-)